MAVQRGFVKTSPDAPGKLERRNPPRARTAAQALANEKVPLGAKTPEEGVSRGHRYHGWYHETLEAEGRSYQAPLRRASVGRESERRSPDRDRGPRHLAALNTSCRPSLQPLENQPTANRA